MQDSSSSKTAQKIQNAVLTHRVLVSDSRTPRPEFSTPNNSGDADASELGLTIAQLNSERRNIESVEGRLRAREYYSNAATSRVNLVLITDIDMTKVTGIHRLTLGVPKLDSVGVYYRDVVGLRVLADGETRWDLQCHTSRHCDFSLVAQQGNPTISAIAFSVRSQKDLFILISAAVNAGGAVLREPAPSSDYPGEFSATVVDPDGNHIELIHLEPKSHEHADETLTSGPQRIGHVVLWTPQIELMEAFFSRLGLNVTDRTAMGMSFLRCNTDHHSVALVRSKRQTGLQHVAFDVGSIDDVMREKGRISSVGVECIWGVGRHGPGNNVFSYYQDPAGNVFEFYGDMEKFIDNGEVREPVFWGAEHRGDVWGVAGPAPRSFRPQTDDRQTTDTL